MLEQVPATSTITTTIYPPSQKTKKKEDQLLYI